MFNSPFGSDVVVTINWPTIVIVSDVVAVLPKWSVTVNPIGLLAAAIGVPVIAPVEEFKVRPVGRAPLLTLHV